MKWKVTSPCTLPSASQYAEGHECWGQVMGTMCTAGCRKVSRELVKDRGQKQARSRRWSCSRFLEKGWLMDVCEIPRGELGISFSIWIIKGVALIWGRIV